MLIGSAINLVTCTQHMSTDLGSAFYAISSDRPLIIFKFTQQTFER